MDYPDGVYLIKSLKTTSILLCFFRNGDRSVGKAVTRPLKNVLTANWPHMSIFETEKNSQITYVGSEDFIAGMTIVNPNMRVKDLLEQLGIDYTIKD